MLKPSITFWRDLLSKEDFEYELTEEDKKSSFIVNHSIGKGSMFIKNNTIPELRAKAEYYKKKAEIYQFKIKNFEKNIEKAVEKTAKIKHKDIVRGLRKVKKQASGIKQREKNRIRKNGGMKLLQDKLRTKILSSTSLMEGAISFPIICNFAKAKKLKLNEFNLLIMCFCFNYVSHNDYEIFGITKASFGYRLGWLTRRNLLDKTKTGKKIIYYVNFRGNNLIKEYQEEYEKVSRVVVKKLYQKEDVADFVNINKIRLSAKKVIDEETRPKDPE